MSFQNYGKSPRKDPLKESLSPPSSPINKKIKLESDAKLISPKKENTTNFESRPNAGSTVVSYGPSNPSNLSGKPKKSATMGTVATVVDVDPRFKPGMKPRFMLESLDAKVLALNQRILDFSEELLASDPDQFGGLLSQSVADVTHDPVWVSGRLVPESDQSKLSMDTLFLEGSREASEGARVKINLAAVPTFRVFPGQVIAAYGTNPLGRCFYAQRLITSLPLPPRSLAAADATTPVQPPSTDDVRDTEGCRMVVAAGPFACTTSESLSSFEPLQTLLKHCAGVPDEGAPDLLILMGPFLDQNHPAIGSGTVDATFEKIVEDQITRRLEDWIRTHPSTAIALVPGGSRDVAALPVFPQPPEITGVKFQRAVPATPGGAKPSSVFSVQAGRITVVPNPCVLSTSSGATVALMATDVLLALSGSEFASRDNAMAQRLSALSCHLLQQRSFYPVYPALPGTCLDTTLLSAADIHVTPDLLVFASDLAPFVKPVGWSDQIGALPSALKGGDKDTSTTTGAAAGRDSNMSSSSSAPSTPIKTAPPPAAGREAMSPASGAAAAPGKVVSVAVNPGRLAIGTSGGTFARITVLPGSGAAVERSKAAIVRV